MFFSYFSLCMVNKGDPSSCKMSSFDISNCSFRHVQCALCTLNKEHAVIFALFALAEILRNIETAECFRFENCISLLLLLSAVSCCIRSTLNPDILIKKVKPGMSKLTQPNSTDCQHTSTAADSPTYKLS